MAKIEALRDALAKDDAEAVTSTVAGYPACVDAPPVALLPSEVPPRDGGCLSEVANALGSKKGFQRTPVDQAAAATVALVLLRDRRGDWIARADDWLTALKTGSGTGHDTLRLAVARTMGDAAPLVGRRIEEDGDARAAMKAIASSVPGACPTYWLLGSGAPLESLSVEHSADHAACVHKDLGRREGPGGKYGSGTFRALEGSLALWRETERALRLGLARMQPGRAREVVEAKIAKIEAATRAIATRKVVATSEAATLSALGEMHADAGALPAKRGAGDRRDGGAGVGDAGR